MRGRLPIILTTALFAVSLPAQASAADTWAPVTPVLTRPDDVRAAGLHDVAAVSPTDVWAIGGGWSDTDGTMITHWTGNGWQNPKKPSAPNLAFWLNGVDAVSASDVWAVGLGQPTPRQWGDPTAAVITHYDGTAWSMAAAPAPPQFNSDQLNDVDMLSATDGFAVGGRTAQYPTGEATAEPLVMRWRNGQWVTMDLPLINDGFARLDRVYARAANDVWAVGVAEWSGLLMHFDGTRWQRISIPHSAIPDSFDSLRAVTALSATDVWAVGDSGVNLDDGSGSWQPYILHLSNGVWQVVPSAGDRGTNLTGVVARASNDVWAVGYDIPPGGQEKVYIEHWDGQSFTTAPTIAPRGGLASALSAATQVPGSTEMWAVGWQNVDPQVLRHG